MSGKENFFGDESDVDYDQTPEQLQEVIANAIFKISDGLEDAKGNVDKLMNSFYYEVSRKIEQKYFEQNLFSKKDIINEILFNVPPWERTDDLRNN